MNEQKRQAYLKAMDIQPYFPRQILVGAKPSPAYEFPAKGAVRPELLEEPAAISVKREAKPEFRPKTQGLDAIEELRAHSKSARKATVTPIRQEQQAPASPNESEVSIEAEAESGLSFNLRYYRINDTMAVLDEIPPQGSGQLNKESQKLMQAILRALGLEFSNASAQAEEFTWPLQAGYSSKHSPKIEAAKALSGFLQMRQETDGFTNLLVFAGKLEELLLQNEQERAARDFESRKGYFLTVTHSLASMLRVPILKRDVWQHLQALRKRLDSSS